MAKNVSGKFLYVVNCVSLYSAVEPRVSMVTEGPDQSVRIAFRSVQINGWGLHEFLYLWDQVNCP